MTTVALDFDRYAQEARHFDVPFVFPEVCARAMCTARGTFADLGAGDGAVVRSAYRQGLLRGFGEVVAVDISPVRIARIEDRAFPGLKGIVADASDVPLPSGSVDFVFSHQVIEHVPDDAAMAREIARLLKPNGKAFVTSVTKRWYGWYFYRCNGKWRLDPTHVREYGSMREYEGIFLQAGLEIESSFERRAAHPLDKVAIWSLVRTGLVRLDAADALIGRPIMRRLGRIEIPIPGYRTAEVLVRRVAG